MDERIRRLRISLDDLVGEQIDESQARPLAGISKEDLFSFIESNFPDAYKFFTGIILGPLNVEGLNEISRRFAGKIFEEVAFIYLVQHLRDFTVLSPKRTKRFFDLLYPNASDIANPAGFDSLDRVQVPDGLIVKSYGSSRKITGFCEFTITENHEIVERKVKGYLAIQSEHTEFFRRANLYFVTPHEGFRCFPQDTRFRMITLPFTRAEFGHFVRSLYTNHPGGSASIGDFVKRAIEQISRAANYMSNGDVPEHQREYLAVRSNHPL
ncbi:hypothetical protein HYX08_01935 [Candidatus Woesearchaeota archaeon]|nr:hypothetical protein [Candidatus Woesearchaeota archaeon]